MAIFRSWFFHCPQLPGNFSADALVHSMYVYLFNALSRQQGRLLWI